MGIDTKIILISCIVTEILTKEGFSVMAALSCILGELPKDDRVASFRFLKSTPRRYGNSKKTLYGRYCTLIGPCHQTIPDGQQDELTDLQNNSITKDLLDDKTDEEFWIYMVCSYT